jgi:dihydroxyacetone kinase, DhaK subunit
MKKIINMPETVVVEMLKGLVKAHPELELVEKFKVVKKAAINKDKVTLISGGGSGHEPAHAGYVGKGMLDAAVAGDVFASPSTIQVYNAILKTQSKKGTLLIIKNYSGDCMNFDGAAEMAKEDDGLEVAQVYVNDDIAVKNSLYTVGRRGVAGTVFVHKLAGAAAEQGKSLTEVKAVAEKAVKNIRSIGFALTSCTVPAKGTPTFQIGDGEMEYGVGIHGEPGIAREPVQTAAALAKRTVAAILADIELTGAEIALMINGFGGTPLQELYLLNNSVSSELEGAGVKIYKTFVGNYMTSIDMAGASVSVLKLDEELKALLDEPSDAPGFLVK